MSSPVKTEVGDLMGENCKNSSMSIIILVGICAMKKPEHPPPCRLFGTNRIPNYHDGASILVRANVGVLLEHEDTGNGQIICRQQQHEVPGIFSCLRGSDFGC